MLSSAGWKNSKLLGWEKRPGCWLPGATATHVGAASLGAPASPPTPVKAEGPPWLIGNSTSTWQGYWLSEWVGGEGEEEVGGQPQI